MKEPRAEVGQTYSRQTMNKVCQVSRSFRVFAIGRSVLPVSDLCLRNSCLLSTCAKELDETGILLAGVQILLVSAAHDWP